MVCSQLIAFFEPLISYGIFVVVLLVVIAFYSFAPVALGRQPVQHVSPEP
jgi:hypothetical protein